MGEHVGDGSTRCSSAPLHRAAAAAGAGCWCSRCRAPRRPPGRRPFIEAYIAPDMHMRPLGETVGLLEAAGFEVRDVQALREHYVCTGRAWLRDASRRDGRARLAWSASRCPGLAAVPCRRRPGLRGRRMGVDQILAGRPGVGAQ